MKKKILVILSALVGIILISCEPQRDSLELGALIDPSAVQLTVENTTPGGNEIHMKNNSSAIEGYWDYIAGGTNAKELTVVLPFMGELDITFYAIGSGGTTKIVKNVTVEKADHEVPAEWGMFAGEGTAGKTWVWATDKACYGTAGYGNDLGPAWNTVSVGGKQQERPIDANDFMVFDLDGGPNFTKSYQGEVENGSFVFTMYNEKQLKWKDNNPANNEVWSYGTLAITGSSVLSGCKFWDANTVATTYEIIKLSEEELILGFASPGTAYGTWQEATYWVFHPKQ
jgi:hypothetical protein